jgi:hypothetical protein
MKAKVNIVNITPGEAEKLLANMFEEQRPVQDAYVVRLSNEMTQGSWHLSPDCLVRIKGKLANGQHRLLAVCRSKISQPFLLMESDDDNLYKVIDSGNKRTVADVIRGEYARDVATAARWIVLYDLDALSPQGAARGGVSCTRSLCIEFIEQHREGLQSAVSKCARLYSEYRTVPASLAAAVLFIGQRNGAGADQVGQFVTHVYTGESSNDAARDFRERVIRSQIGNARLTRFYIMALMIKSLRSYLNGTRLGVVRLSEGEKFPHL